MIFTDGTHLVSDKSTAELHEFAGRIGLKREWFQGHNQASPHYDILARRIYQRAVKFGAIETDGKGVVYALRRWRANQGGKT